MRTIKFRYWNSKEGKVYPQPDRGWDGFPHKLHKDDEWLEFTGLLDKNGKEIYEGDVVYIKNIRNHKGPKHNYQKYTVVWGHNKFTLCLRLRNRVNDMYYFKSLRWLADKQDRAEVVGNKYEGIKDNLPRNKIENPELIK